jgi:hypothetical protein
MNITRPALASLLAMGIVATAQDSAAGFKVYTPKVEQGEFEIEYRPSVTLDSNKTKDNEQKHVLGVGYGVTDWWFTEVYAEWEREPGSGMETAFEAFEWENRFELTEPGKNWADLGLYVEYERKDDGNAPDKLELGVIAAKSVGRLDFALNVLFEREIGANASSDIELVQAFQAKYRLDPAFEPGFELHSGFGPIGDMPAFDAQEHYAGPIVEGKMPLGDTGATFKYNVGYMFGLTDETPDGTVKAELEIEFEF